MLQAFVQILDHHFWKEWRNSYLQTLQKRQKWYLRKKSVKIGDIVLLRDKQVKRNKWPLAQVVDVKLSADLNVRSVKIKVAKTVGSEIEFYYYDRPVHELVYLLSP